MISYRILRSLWCGNSLPTFQNNLSVPSVRDIGCPETLVTNYHYTLPKKSAYLIYFAAEACNDALQSAYLVPRQREK